MFVSTDVVTGLRNKSGFTVQLKTAVNQNQLTSEGSCLTRAVSSVDFKIFLLLIDVRWPSSDPVILNSGSRWTESVRDPNTVAKDLLSRMIKMLKGNKL